jgi:hypothetical protein
MHLNADELIDIAEGTRPETSAPHLAGCEACRTQLAGLRATMAAAREIDVPEPSPLFWDHLSSRVHDAVAADARLKPSRSFPGEALAAITALFGMRAFQASAVVAAGLLIAVVLSSRATVPAPITAPSVATIADTSAPVELLSDITAEDDASLTLVASLTADLDLDAAGEAGLTPRGSAEHAVTHMSDGELRELGRILREELSHEM